jgi:hypothetical protein
VTEFKTTEPTDEDRRHFAAKLAARGCDAGELAALTGIDEESARKRLADTEFSKLAAGYAASFDRHDGGDIDRLTLDTMLALVLGYHPQRRPW